MADIDALLSEIEANDKPLTVAETGLGLARSVLSGPTFNYGDNLEALLFSVVGPRTYGEELAGIRAEQDRFKQKVDYVDNAVEIGASFLNPLSALDKIKKGSSLASTLAKVVRNPVAESAIAGAGLADGGDVVQSALLGAGGGVIGAGTSSVVGKGLQTAGKEADRLKLSAFGIGYQDIKNQIKKAGDFFAKTGGDLPILGVVDKAEKEGIINAGNEAVENLASVLGKQETISKELKAVIAQVDQAMPPGAGQGAILGGKKLPQKDFQTSNTEQYIKSLSGTAKEKAQQAAEKEIAALKTQMQSGSVAELQDLKVGLNYKYDKNPYTEDIIKAIRQDLKEEIENRINNAVSKGLVPKDLQDSARLLNSEWGGLADLRDAFNKGLAKDYGGDAVEDFYRSFQTTGGAGSFNIMSAASGNPLWSLLGQGLNLVRYNENKSAFADVLRTFQKPLGKAGDLVSGITGRSSVQGLEASGINDAILNGGRSEPKAAQPLSIDDLLGEIEGSLNSGKNPTQSPQAQTGSQGVVNSLLPGSQPGPVNTSLSNSIPTASPTQVNDFAFMNTLFKGDKMDIKPAQVIEEIKKNPVDHAIALMESNLNPKAKNPESSASGLFQLIKKTAGSLGVKNVFDPAENYKGYLQLKQATIDKFDIDPNDYRSIYASHYLGEGTFKKWLDGDKLSPAQAKQVQELEEILFPRLDKLYAKAVKEASGVVTA